jgi:hypothetical protein
MASTAGATGSGWKHAVSGAIRHTSDQLGGRSPAWNQAVYNAAVHAHRLMGLDPNDAQTTWPQTKFEPPRNANHEANTANRWHLILFCVAVIAIAWRRERRCLLYASGIAAAFLAFCLYLKWQPFMARLLLPLFVLASPACGRAIEMLRFPVLQAAVCLLLLNNSRPYLFENWTRRLTGPDNLFTTSREFQYFNDMVQWNNRDSYLKAVELTVASGCARIGIDLSRNQLEYPFQALVLRQRHEARFLHVGVSNRPARYSPRQELPCAVLCLDCAGYPELENRYRAIGEATRIGHFLLFRAG